MISASEIRAGVLPFQEEWRKRPVVLSVGIGELTEQGEYCVVVGLNDQLRYHTDDFPDHIMVQDVSVCVRKEMLSPTAFAMANGALDGSDLLVASEVGRVGTLGLVLRDAKTDALLGLTNAHVVTRPNENHVGDRVQATLAGISQDIGHVAFHSNYNSTGTNSVDLALIKLNANGIARAREFEVQTFPGSVVGSGGLSFSRFAGSQRPHAYGASTQTSRHVVACVRPVEHSRVDLQDSTGPVLQFGRAFTLTAGGGGVLPGHSGALIVREMANQDLIAVGLLAAGQGGTAIAFSMSDVIREISRTGIEIA